MHASLHEILGRWMALVSCLEMETLIQKLDKRSKRKIIQSFTIKWNAQIKLFKPWLITHMYPNILGLKILDICLKIPCAKAFLLMLRLRWEIAKLVVFHWGITPQNRISRITPPFWSTLFPHLKTQPSVQNHAQGSYHQCRIHFTVEKCKEYIYNRVFHLVVVFQLMVDDCNNGNLD